jgi:hypothetical protein
VPGQKDEIAGMNAAFDIDEHESVLAELLNPGPRHRGH